MCAALGQGGTPHSVGARPRALTHTYKIGVYMAKVVKLSKVDDIKNAFENLYSKYNFLCTVDKYLWEFADDNFELFAMNFLHFLKTLDSEFEYINNSLLALFPEEDSKECDEILKFLEENNNIEETRSN